MSWWVAAAHLKIRDGTRVSVEQMIAALRAGAEQVILYGIPSVARHQSHVES
jgi:delta-aminolevulinic acid dehydratase/porphobilinogen synthase